MQIICPVRSLGSEEDRLDQTCFKSLICFAGNLDRWINADTGGARGLENQNGGSARAISIKKRVTWSKSRRKTYLFHTFFNRTKRSISQHVTWPRAWPKREGCSVLVPSAKQQHFTQRGLGRTSYRNDSRNKSRYFSETTWIY